MKFHARRHHGGGHHSGHYGGHYGGHSNYYNYGGHYNGHHDHYGQLFYNSLNWRPTYEFKALDNEYTMVKLPSGSYFMVPKWNYLSFIKNPIQSPSEYVIIGNIFIPKDIFSDVTLSWAKERIMKT
jgi:hypothetical protein